MTATSSMRRAPGRLRELLGRGSPAPVVAALPAALTELARNGPAPLSGRKPAADAQLRIATIVPSFRHGSGGHMTIVNLLRELGKLGHDVSLWLEDCEGRHSREAASLTRESFAEFFAWDGPPLHTDFGEWTDTDVVLATGWQTVARALLLPDVAAHAYLVQDHEPDFYPASAERLFAEETYRQGLHCIAASKWLAELLRTRYGASASHFDLAVDHSIYRPSKEPRREDLVVFYARAVTPRRAVPLGLMALAELADKRPGVEIALFGEDRPIDVPFAHTNLGVLSAQELAALYRRATVGMVLSLTNPSLIGLEMMACGLACVELASESMVTSFGHNGPLWLSELRPLELCLALEGLLEDASRREAMATAGRAFMSARTWQGAASQLEHAVSSLVWRT